MDPFFQENTKKTDGASPFGFIRDRVWFTCFLGGTRGHRRSRHRENTLKGCPRLLKTTRISAHEQLNIYRRCTLLGRGRLRFDATIDRGGSRSGLVHMFFRGNPGRRSSRPLT